MSKDHDQQKRGDARTERPQPARTHRPDGAAPTPCSNTGAKVENNLSIQGSETSTTWEGDFQPERFAIRRFGVNGVVVQHPIPNEAGTAAAALVDWLSFTLRPPENETHEWVIRELQRMGLVETVVGMKGGYAGYAKKAQCQDGKIRLCLIAWGGKKQKGTVYVSFTGHGCARIENWMMVAAWLEQHKATITRLDLAYDDFNGEKISMEKVVEWYQSGGFSAGGRTPRHTMYGDWLSGDESVYGRTFLTGSRDSGKVCRAYEKGKQLGEPSSPWVRVEVEWHHQDRIIPYAALTEPGKYLSGAYACMNFLSEEQSRIRTTQRAGKIAFERAMANGKQLAGKLLNLALEVYQGDYAEVVERLKRDGYPARIDPYSYVFKGSPEILNGEPPMVGGGLVAYTG